jgi:hypothetical protein
MICKKRISGLRNCWLLKRKFAIIKRAKKNETELFLLPQLIRCSLLVRVFSNFLLALSPDRAFFLPTLICTKRIATMRNHGLHIGWVKGI